MTENEPKATRSTRIAFLNCKDATLRVADVELTDDERERVQAALAWLEHSGLVWYQTGIRRIEPAPTRACWRLCVRAWARLHCKRRLVPNGGSR